MIKKIAATLFVACCSLLAAKESPTDPLSQKSPGAKTSFSNKKELASSLSHSQMGSGEIMIISPEMRAKDLQSAYNYLKTTSSIAKVSIKLKNGQSITEITAMDVMPGGTIIIFHTNTTQGIKNHVINIENVESIGDD